MGVTSNSLLDFLYNKKLPQVYRDEDSKIGYPLKRYLESLVEGGYKGALTDIEGLMSITDPKKIPENLFPYLCESFGLEFFPDIELIHQRRFLLNLGELVKRRGTYSSIHYLIRALTGLEAEITLEGNDLNIVLLAKYVEQVLNIESSKKLIGNYIRSHIPYYINPVISSKVDTQLLNSKSYAHSAMTLNKRYTLKAYKEGI